VSFLRPKSGSARSIPLDVVCFFIAIRRLSGRILYRPVTASLPKAPRSALTFFLFSSSPHPTEGADSLSPSCCVSPEKAALVPAFFSRCTYCFCFSLPPPASLWSADKGPVLSRTFPISLLPPLSGKSDELILLGPNQFFLFLPVPCSWLLVRCFPLTSQKRPLSPFKVSPGFHFSQGLRMGVVLTSLRSHMFCRPKAPPSPAVSRILGLIPWHVFSKFLPLAKKPPCLHRYRLKGVPFLSASIHPLAMISQSLTPDSPHFLPACGNAIGIFFFASFRRFTVFDPPCWTLCPRP